MPKHASTTPLDAEAKVRELGFWRDLPRRFRREFYSLPRPAHITPATSENQETSG